MVRLGSPVNLRLLGDYLECARKGLTQAETGRALKRSRQSVSRAAKTYNISFRSGGNSTAYSREKQSEAARKWWKDPANNRLAVLTPENFKVYKKLRRAQYTGDEAFTMAMELQKEA